GVDQQMVMPGVLAIRPGGSHTHVAQAEIELELRRHGRAVLEVDEIHLGTGTGRGGAASARSLRKRSAACCDAHDQQRHDPAGALAASRRDLVEPVHGYILRSGRSLRDTVALTTAT